MTRRNVFNALDLGVGQETLQVGTALGDLVVDHLDLSIAQHPVVGAGAVAVIVRVDRGKIEDHPEKISLTVRKGTHGRVGLGHHISTLRAFAVCWHIGVIMTRVTIPRHVA